MRERFYVVYFILKSIFSYWFQRSNHSPLYLAGKSLFQKSFRIPQKFDQSFYFFVVVMKQIIRRYRCQEPHFISYSDSPYCENLIYDLQLNSAPLRYDYTCYHSQLKIHGFLAKDSLLNRSSIWTCLGDLVQGLLLFLILFPYSILFKNKRAISQQIIIESIEIYRLYKICSQKKVRRVFFFSIYEKDANISTLLMQHLGIEVYKIPSEVPLCFWNKIIVANVLCICNSYQYEEIDFYKSDMLFDKTEFWGPEMMLKVQKQYTQHPTHNPKLILGFYSTASWVRALHGHMDQGVNMQENEHLLKTYLKEYCSMRTDIELIVFLHPKEKKETILEHTKKHYQSYFEGINYKFAPFEKSTSELFANVNLAVAFNSTVIYERLYFGFKCLMMPLFTGEFPIKTSPLKNICAFSKYELIQKIDSNIALTPIQFFTQNHIENYPYYGK